jgi:hypothetical protein
MEGRMVVNCHVLVGCAKLRYVTRRVVSQCQSAVAEAVEAFGRIDVLLGSTSEGIRSAQLR